MHTDKTEQLNRYLASRIKANGCKEAKADVRVDIISTFDNFVNDAKLRINELAKIYDSISVSNWFEIHKIGEDKVLVTLTFRG